MSNKMTLLVMLCALGFAPCISQAQGADGVIVAGKSIATTGKVLQQSMAEAVGTSIKFSATIPVENISAAVTSAALNAAKVPSVAPSITSTIVPSTPDITTAVPSVTRVTPSLQQSPELPLSAVLIDLPSICIKTDAKQPQNGTFGDIQKTVQLQQDVKAPDANGKEQLFRAGDFLNITDLNNIYGISEVEFYKTYAMVKADSRELTKLYLQDLPRQELFNTVGIYTAKHSSVKARRAEGNELNGRAHWGDWIIETSEGQQYVMGKTEFSKMYEPNTELGDGWFKATDKPQIFIQPKWGMYIKNGPVSQLVYEKHYLNISTGQEVYAVHRLDFPDLYTPVKTAAD